jgi:hypothetical protein
VQATNNNGTALFNPQLPTQWSQSNNDRIVERLACGAGVNAHLDPNDRPGWRVGGGVGYTNGGGGGSPVYRGALLTAANCEIREFNEFNAIGSKGTTAISRGGSPKNSPHGNLKPAANLLEQVANDHQRRGGSPRGKKKNVLLSPLSASDRRAQGHKNNLFVSTGASSPLRRAMSHKL